MRRTRVRRRRGAALLTALVCLAVVAAATTFVVQKMVAERDRLRNEAERLQASVLAESALDRAVAKLAVDPSYSGETWTVRAEELGGEDGAVAAIRVEPIPGRPEARRIVIQADYPNRELFRSRRSLEAVAAVR